jgi:hypothetical protein
MSWTCPDCGKAFRNRNQWHSCYTLNIEDHLRNKPEVIRNVVYDLISAIGQFGPIELNPVKSVIQVKAGATFLSIKPKKDFIELEFQLGDEIDQFPVHRTVRISGNRVLHFLYIQSSEDINDQLLEWLRSSYILVSHTGK